MSDQCKDELRDFKRDRGTNINKDVSLGGPSSSPLPSSPSPFNRCSSYISKPQARTMPGLPSSEHTRSAVSSASRRQWAFIAMKAQVGMRGCCQAKQRW